MHPGQKGTGLEGQIMTNFVASSGQEAAYRVIDRWWCNVLAFHDDVVMMNGKGRSSASNLWDV